jgi:hypothetical protein
MGEVVPIFWHFYVASSSFGTIEAVLVHGSLALDDDETSTLQMLTLQPSGSRPVLSYNHLLPH